MKRIALSTGLAADLVVLAAASSFAVDRGTRPTVVRVNEPAAITMMAIGLGGLAAANFLRKRKK